MNTYTIEYHFGTYEGIEVVRATDEEHAIARMWKRLNPTLAMAYKSARIIDVVYGDDNDD